MTDSSWSAEDECENILALPYIAQTKRDGYACCQAIALLNAVIYYQPERSDLPRPGTLAWEILVDACGCRFGGTINVEWIKIRYGLETIPVPQDESICASLVSRGIPLLFSLHTPIGWHATLAVLSEHRPRRQARFQFVNYQSFKGKLVEERRWGELKFGGTFPQAVILGRKRCRFGPFPEE